MQIELNGFVTSELEMLAREMSALCFVFQLPDITPNLISIRELQAKDLSQSAIDVSLSVCLFVGSSVVSSFICIPVFYFSLYCQFSNMLFLN